MGEVRTITPGRFSLIRPLFQQVFGSEISEEMLAWKYADGRGVSYGYFNDVGELLVHCGLSYRRVLADGQLHRIGHIGDLMAAPGRHGGLGRAASFTQVVRRLLGDLPDAQNPDGLAFGFPSDRAMRLGEQLGLFSSIDQMHQLTFAALPRRWRSDQLVPVGEPDRAFRKDVDRLWHEMAASLGSDLICVRDADYLSFRYFRHPAHRYVCHAVKPWWGGRPVGIIVTRCEGEQCELLDLIGSPAQMGRLIQAARQQLGHWGTVRMLLWLTQRHAAQCVEQAYSNERLELRIMANPFSSGGNPRRFAGRWWLTSGDTDYH